MNLEDSEIQRAYDAAIGDLRYYEESAKAHQENLNYAKMRIKETQEFLKTVNKRAAELGVTLKD